MFTVTVKQKKKLKNGYYTSAPFTLNSSLSKPGSFSNLVSYYIRQLGIIEKHFTSGINKHK